MRRLGWWLAWGLGAVLGLPLLALLALLVFANSQGGQAWIARTVSGLGGGEVRLDGLSGRFPDALRLARLELRDAQGPWLAAEGLALDWSPARLLAGVAQVERVEAGHIALARLPAGGPEEKETSSDFSLPVGIVLRRLRVERLDLAQAVAGQAVRLALGGEGELSSLEQGRLDLSIDEPDGTGRYRLQASLAGGQAHARLSLREPERGLLGGWAGIEQWQALAVDAALDGPLSAMASRITLDFGPLHVQGQGGLDLQSGRFDAFAVEAAAPPLRPRPDLSWQILGLQARLDGPFARPVVQGRLRAENLQAVGVSARALTLDAQGDAGRTLLKGELAGLRLPGPQPGLLEAAPLLVSADAQWEQPGGPVAFALEHPVFVFVGKVGTADALRAEAVLRLPDLRPLAALGGVEAQGKATLNLRFAQRGKANTLVADGVLSLERAAAPLPGLLGGQAKLALALEQEGEDLRIPRLGLEGKALDLSAEGSLLAGQAEVQARLALKDLAVLADGLSGKLAARLKLAGPLDKLAVAADLDGELAARGLPRGPVTAKLRLDGLPGAPSGQMTARGVVAGAPLDLALNAQAPAGGPLRLGIERADWKSLHAQGGLSLPPGAGLPSGKVELRMAKLDDLRPLLGRPLVGSLAASLEATPQAGRLLVELREAGLPGQATATRVDLDLSAKPPLARPALAGRLALEGIAAAGLGGSARLDLAGPWDALGLELGADVQTQAGPLRLDAAAKLDAPGRTLALAGASAVWKQESLRLLQAARLRFADGLAVDGLRLGLREAVLELGGRLQPRLDLQASLSNVPAGLASWFAPGLDLAGSLRAEARLGGSLERPAGRVEAWVEGLRMKAGPGRGLPPLKLAAAATLDGGPCARLDVQAEAGADTRLTVAGAVPLAAACAFDLHAGGALDLKLSDAWLAAEGRRLRGRLGVDGGLAGTLAAPQVTGVIRLDGGEVQDYGSGARLADIAALVQAEGGTLRLAKFEGKAGPGRVSASGSLDLSAEGMPLDLLLDAHDARPIASDRLSVDLDARLALRGRLDAALAAAGAVHIKRAEIRIPERLPASVAVLRVVRPGEVPPPPPPPSRELGLDLAIDAPGQIFVRGRGLEAELGGKVRLRGTAAKPQPDGGFSLRRGQFSLAGQTLVFSKGEVGFDGGSLADPSLDFLAKAGGGSVTAFLAVGGTANKPKISLSSTPELPQDEVLAQLLFGRATANLSPLELAQIASALASLSGVTAGAGDALDGLRKTFGLDRLAVGANVEAGRYLAPGVYLGAKQGIAGGSTQATVQIDIAKGLKLEAAAGTGSPATGSAGATGTNSVGVVYQYEY